MDSAVERGLSEPNPTHCLVCLDIISWNTSYILSKCKTRLNTLLVDKVHEIAKENYIQLTVLNGIDAVCEECFNILDLIESLEHQVYELKLNFAKHLRNNYGKVAIEISITTAKNNVDDAIICESDTRIRSSSCNTEIEKQDLDKIIKDKNVITSSHSVIRTSKRARKHVKRYIEVQEQELGLTSTVVVPDENYCTESRYSDKLMEAVVVLDKLDVTKESGTDTRTPLTSKTKQKSESEANSVVILKRLYRCADCASEYGSSESYLSHLQNGICPKATGVIPPIKDTEDSENQLLKDNDPKSEIIVQNAQTSKIHPKGKLIPLKCTQCSLVFHTKTSLRVHKKNHHVSIYNLKCPEPGCKFITGRNVNLQQHLVVHKRGTLNVKSSVVKSNKSINGSGSTTSIKSPVDKSVKNIDDIIAYHENILKASVVKPNVLRSSNSTSEIPNSNLESNSEVELRVRCEIRNCNAYFLDLNHLKEHKTAVHKPHHCENCNERFFVERDLFFHETQEHNIKHPHVSCHLCKTIFFKKALLRRHLLRIHRVLNYHPCKLEGCSYVATLRTELNNHMLTHAGKKVKFQCSICSQGFQSQASYRRHQSQTHSIQLPCATKKRVRKTYTCDACGSTFSSCKDYSRHTKKNCPNGGPTERKIQRQKRARLLCEECGKSFMNPESLKGHTLTHKGIVLYQCPVCGKGFNVKGFFKNHQKIHGDQKPYQCDQCGNTYKYEVSLTIHLASMHNIFPKKVFPCEYCGKICITSSHRQTHIRRYHTVVKPFPCRFHDCCSSRFATSHERKIHEYHHKKIYPFNCLICGRGEPSWYKHKRHLKGKHGVYDDVDRYTRIVKMEKEGRIKLCPSLTEEEIKKEKILSDTESESGTADIDTELPDSLETGCIEYNPLDLNMPECETSLEHSQESIPVDPELIDEQQLAVINDNGEILEYVIIEDGDIVTVCTE